MGTETKLDHSPDRKLHIDIMRDIARDMHDLPMVLKGGTALLLCYGLDRFSEDLDFDSPKKFNIATRIERILSRHSSEYEVKIVKDTNTVQRIKSHYKGVVGERLLKIETSFRSQPEVDQIEIVDGVRTYKIESLFRQKIDALENRTAARDLYDVAFLIRNYFSHFPNDSLEKLISLVQDIDALEQRFRDAFEEDEILDGNGLLSLILQISQAISR